MEAFQIMMILHCIRSSEQAYYRDRKESYRLTHFLSSIFASSDYDVILSRRWCTNW